MFKVNCVSGLSGVACCFPACPLFMRLPGNVSEAKQRALLKEHLLYASPVLIPGLHQGVFSPGAGEDQILKGEVLKPAWPERRSGGPAKKKEDYETNLAIKLGKSVEELRSFLHDCCEKLRAQEQAYEEFKEIFDKAFSSF